ncbi:MAG: hypothetical protein ACO1Q7_03010 [Gemmatimonas sp.]
MNNPAGSNPRRRRSVDPTILQFRTYLSVCLTLVSSLALTWHHTGAWSLVQGALTSFTMICVVGALHYAVRAREIVEPQAIRFWMRPAIGVILLFAITTGAFTLWRLSA